ncbi:Fc.00g113600.m01.CDS01 [Cosmosporella sp. VM-42]
MPLEVLPATEEDLPRSIAIENVAYTTSAVNDVLFPGPSPPEAGKARLTALTKQMSSKSSCRFMKVVDPDLPEEDKAISFALWFFWETPRIGPSTPPRTWGPGTNPEACKLFFGGMDKRRDEIMEGKPYVYLKLLHTDPKHQRRGAASMLLKWGLAEADRLGLPIFLEASRDGRPLYEKVGFDVVETIKVDFSPWGGPSEGWGPMMLRPAVESQAQKE